MRFFIFISLMFCLLFSKAQADYSYLYQSALQYDSAKNYSEALKVLSKIIDENKTTNDSVLLLRARVYFEMRETHKAFKDAEASIKLNEKNDKSYFLLGMIKSKNENFPGAIKAFNKAIALKPTEAKYYYDRGVAYLLQEDIDDAQKDFKKTIELNKSYAHAWYSLGYTQELMKQSDEALKSLYVAIELNNQYTEAYTEIAFIHLKKGDKSKACEVYNNAIKAGCKMNEELKTNFCQ